MWEFLLVAAAGTGFLARCLGKRHALLREEEEPIENEVCNCYDDNSGSVELASELDLKITTQIFNGEGFQIRGGTKIVPCVSPRREQDSGDVSATFIYSHDGFIRPVMPSSSWKGKAKGFHGCRGRRFSLDAQCSEILDFELSEDHGSNTEPMQKTNLRKKIMTGFQKRKKVSRHVAGRSWMLILLGIVNQQKSTDSSDVADEGLYANGLPGQWSSANKTPFVRSEVFHADDYGVSPYELDRRLCELLAKQQEETISELEGELKSTENELHDKEIELQQWKEHVRRLLELSFVTNSGDESASLDSVSFNGTNNADGKRQQARQVL